MPTSYPHCVRTLHLNMCIDMCVDMYIDMCIDMCPSVFVCFSHTHTHTHSLSLSSDGAGWSQYYFLQWPKYTA